MKKRDPNDGEISKRLRAVRLQRGMTQTELGTLLGVTFQQVQKYEKGSNRVSAGRLQRIADIFEMPITFFYTGGAGKPTERKPAPDLDLFQTADTLRLARAYSKIRSGRVRSELLRLATALAGDGTSHR